MPHRYAPVLLAAALLAPRPADAIASVEAFYGLTRPPSAGFRAAVSGAVHDPDLIHDSLQLAGGTLLLHLGFLELGGIVDTSWKSGSASQTAIGALGGIGGDFGGALRLELLGEIGGQRYGNFFKNPNIVTAGSSSEWLAYLGLRPGIAYRFDLGGPGLLVGLWGFARWDLTRSSVPVTVASAGSVAPGEVKLGGTTVGVVARVGLDF